MALGNLESSVIVYRKQLESSVHIYVHVYFQDLFETPFELDSL